MKPIFKAIISIALPLAVGAVSGFFTTASVNGWYAGVNKPSFNPPNWLFAPVWTSLYILMGIACFIIWNNNAETKEKQVALRFYGIQLGLNFLWSFIFFYAQQPGWAFIEIILMWIMILLTPYLFVKYQPWQPGSWFLISVG